MSKATESAFIKITSERNTGSLTNFLRSSSMVLQWVFFIRLCTSLKLMGK